MDDPNPQLESLVDQGGLTKVVEDLIAVCAAKADHLRTNWQDELTARAWESDAKKLAWTLNKLNH